MTNLEFLEKIQAPIYLNTEEHIYYVKIPFAFYNSYDSYLDNYNNCIYIKLTDELLIDDDIEYFILSKDNNYDYLVDGNFDLISSNNYLYFTLINNRGKFTEEEILNTYQTFAQILKDEAYITDEMLIKTQIYKKIISYYANGKMDDTVSSLSLILNSTAYSYIDTNKYSICGCNSSSNNSTDITTSQQSCLDTYLNSISLYIKQMFGDIDFYKNFFFLESVDPNIEMIDQLIELLELILNLLNNGQQLLSNKSQHNHCICGELDTIDTSNYNIILNYIQVLNWIKNCEINENINKIQIYGNQFGEIFPNLYFS